MFKQEKGVTLVALVITIIVLLILAGVSIAMTSGQNGIFTKANTAVVRDAISSGKDAVTLKATDNLSEYYDKTYVSGSSSTSTATTAKEAALAAASATTSNTKIEIYEAADDKIVVKYDDKNYAVGTVDENGGISWADSFDTTTAPPAKKA